MFQTAIRRQTSTATAASSAGCVIDFTSLVSSLFSLLRLAIKSYKSLSVATSIFSRVHKGNERETKQRAYIWDDVTI